VGKAVGGRVDVGGTGVNVRVDVAEGTADAMLGGAEVAQAESKTNTNIQTPNRFIQAFLKTEFHPSLAKVGSCQWEYADETFARLYAFGVL
jgi:hypothetical protein